jgi:hypothetical protein
MTAAAQGRRTCAANGRSARLEMCARVCNECVCMFGHVCVYICVHAYVRMYVRVWANAYLNVLCVCVIACATVEQITPALAPPLTSAGWAPQFPPAVGIC